MDWCNPIISSFCVSSVSCCPRIGRAVFSSNSEFIVSCSCSRTSILFLGRQKHNVQATQRRDTLGALQHERMCSHGIILHDIIMILLLLSPKASATWSQLMPWDGFQSILWPTSNRRKKDKWASKAFFDQPAIVGGKTNGSTASW